MKLKTLIVSLAFVVSTASASGMCYYNATNMMLANTTYAHPSMVTPGASINPNEMAMQEMQQFMALHVFAPLLFGVVDKIGFTWVFDIIEYGKNLFKCVEVCDVLSKVSGNTSFKATCNQEVCAKLSTTPWSDAGKALEDARKADLKKRRGW